MLVNGQLFPNPSMYSKKRFKQIYSVLVMVTPGLADGGERTDAQTSAHGGALSSSSLASVASRSDRESFRYYAQAQSSPCLGQGTRYLLDV